MADNLVDADVSHSNFFNRYIGLNLQYWQNCITRSGHYLAFDQERERIVRAISFGLERPEYWTITYALILTCSPHIENRGFGQQWNSILLRAIKVANRISDIIAEINLSIIIARLLRRQGDFNQAVQIYRKIVRLSHQSNDAFNKARAYTNLGYLYIEHGYWWRAEVLCHHALTLFDQLDSNHGRAHTQNHLGLLYTRLYAWHDAQTYLEQACKTWRTMNDNQGLLFGLINLGLLHNEMECPNRALLYLRQALALAEQTGDEAQLGAIYINIGIAYRLMGMPFEAKIHAQKAERIYQSFSNILGIGLAWDNCGLACLDQGKWTEAKQYFENALSIWYQLKNEHDIIRTQLYLVELELAQNNQSQALNSLNELEKLNNQNNWFRQYSALKELFMKCRHSLVERKTQLAVTS